MTASENEVKTIGNMNGPWQLLLKVLLVCFVPWSSFITVETVLSHQFRNAGPRFTPADAQLLISAHASQPGHAVMDSRVTNLETLFAHISAVEAEETELLRRIADAIEDQR